MDPERNIRKETSRRHLGLIIGAVAILGLLVALGSSFELDEPSADQTVVADLGIGDCFAYPGDGVTPTGVLTVGCQDLHYAEVVGIANAGDDEGCVTAFETYTGAENYWETGYILGFLDHQPGLMVCYAYQATDSTGSIRG